MPDPAPRINATQEALRNTARLIGLFVLGLGALVLTGWATGVPALTSFGPRLPRMLPNTALALALLGMALWLRVATMPPNLASVSGGLAAGLAVIVTALGGLTLAEHLIDLRLPVDGALLPGGEDSNSMAGRVPFTTAISLSCLGAGLLLIGAGTAAATSAQILALLAALNGVRIMFGFIDGAGARYAITSPSDVALHTGIATMLLGVGVLCARPRAGVMQVVSGPGYGSHVLRLLLPPAVLLPLLIGALTLRGQEAGLFSLSLGMIVLTLANLTVFWWLARALNSSETTAELEAQRARSLLALAELRTGRLQALRRVDQAIIHEHQAVGAMLDVLLEQTRSQMGVDAAAVLLMQPGQNTLIYARRSGFHTSPETVLATNDESYLGVALRKQAAASSAHTAKPSHFAEEGFVAGFAAPMVIEGQITGVLEVAHRSSFSLDAEGTQFLETLAGQGAIALATFRLFTDLERANGALVRAYDETLAGWSYALELRDGETQGHTQRVTELTLRLAEAFGLSSEELVNIRRGAMLHDIGKLGVPDSILLKPGRLTEDEWAVMRRHPVYAYQWLRPIAYLWPALAIPYCHHERWDGTGYPRGLRGEEIPLPARIFAVVDVWDALCSERPYHPPWPAERVREYIREQAGTHFDPRVVEMFLRIVSEEDAPQWREAGL